MKSPLLCRFRQKRLGFFVMVIFFASLLNVTLQVKNIEAARYVSNDSSDLTTNASNQIDSRIGAANPGTGLNLYTDRPATVGSSWVINQDSWTMKGTPLDFTGILGWRDGGAVYQSGATLITPRHFISAAHVHLTNGENVYYFNKSGSPVARTVVSTYTIPGTDINVGLLNKDVDSSIVYYPLIDGSALDSSLVRVSGKIDVPIVVFHQSKQASIDRMTDENGTTIYHLMYDSGLRNNFWSPIMGGIRVVRGFSSSITSRYFFLSIIQPDQLPISDII